jgi:hypothetical protein
MVHNGSLILLKQVSRAGSLNTELMKMEWTGRSTWGFAWHELRKISEKPWNEVAPEKQFPIMKKAFKFYEERSLPVFDKHIHNVERDYRILKWISLVSPSLNYRLTTADLAGTGVENYLDELHQVRTYLPYFHSALIKEAKTDLLFPNQAFRCGRYPDDKSLPPIYNELEPFKFRAIPISKRIKGSLLSNFVLAGYAVLLFMLSFMAFIKAKEV